MCYRLQNTFCLRAVVPEVTSTVSCESIELSGSLKNDRFLHLTLLCQARIEYLDLACFFSFLLMASSFFIILGKTSYFCVSYLGEFFLKNFHDKLK